MLELLISALLAVGALALALGLFKTWRERRAQGAIEAR